MKDFDFKYANHKVGGLKTHTRGDEVAKGYKPDLTLVDQNGQLRFIFECERGTNRKAFLGAFIKAEKHTEETRTFPTLVFVMLPAPNTTVEQIANHLRPYVLWLDGSLARGLNLTEDLVLSEEQYRLSNENGENIGSDAFRNRARVLTVPSRSTSEKDPPDR